MSGLSDLARRLESMSGVLPRAVEKGVAFAQREVLKAGEAGGALRAGNAATARVSVVGTGLQIVRVGSKGGAFAYGIRADFLALWVANAALREAAEKLRG